MSVEVRGSGRGRVGVVYTLTCTVTLSHRARDSFVSIQWQGPSTDEQTTDDTTGITYSTGSSIVEKIPLHNKLKHEKGKLRQL